MELQAEPGDFVGPMPEVGVAGARQVAEPGVAAESGAGLESGASSQWLPTALAAAGLAILVMTLVRTMRRSNARRRAEGTPKERIQSVRASAEREQLSNLMVDVEELTRRFAAQLDNKAARLEMLLGDADERIRRLESLEGRSGGGGPRGRASGEHEEALDDLADPVTRDVYRLADEGCSPLEIARRLDQHAGKVELILALRNV